MMTKTTHGIARLLESHVTSCHALSQLLKRERRAVTLCIAPTTIVFMDTSSTTAQDQLLKTVEEEIKVSEQVTQELKYRRNALVPISRLPPETLAEIFSLLVFSEDDDEDDDDDEDVPYLEWIRVTHVCHGWREVALSSPSLWNHIDFTKLTLAVFTEILARARMSPLDIKAETSLWSISRFNTFGTQLEAHISRIQHISISGNSQTVIERLVSPAPALVSLSLRNSHREYTIPDSLFNGSAPKLIYLQLIGCGISWKSPLLKGLRCLEIMTPCALAMPTLEDWLAALNEMSQLMRLHTATSTVFVDNTLISDPRRTVTLPSLAHFSMFASAKTCALALAHLVLPVLRSLNVICDSHSSHGDDVRSLMPYVAPIVHGLQDRTPLQTILFNGEAKKAEIVAWTVPDASVEFFNSDDFEDATKSVPLSLMFIPKSRWRKATNTVVFDAMLSHLPLDAILTLSAQNNTRLSKEVWLRHAPRLTMLKQVFLVPTAVRAFRQMLEEDVPPNGLPRLPRLTKLVLSKVSLTAPRTCHLRDMLVKRKEHGAPLEALDLRTCIGTERAFQLLSETVGNVQVPAKTSQVGLSAHFSWEGRVGPFNEEEDRTDDDEYDDGPGPW